jgi:hypothetical protein
MMSSLVALSTVDARCYSVPGFLRFYKSILVFKMLFDR